MRKETRAFVATVAGELTLPDPIVEIGALQIEGQEKYADLRPLFPGRAFIGCDMRLGPGVDRVENLHALTFGDASVGTLIMLDTLEHVQYPFDAMREVHRVLQPGGVVVMTSVMLCPIHGYPSDYWRFTPEAFKTLLQPFATRWVFSDRPALFPRSVYGVGIKGAAGDDIGARLAVAVERDVVARFFGAPAMSIITVDGNMVTVTRRSTRGKLLFALRALELARLRLRRAWKRLTGRARQQGA
jgi:SAM-dependent methyltransferase